MIESLVRAALKQRLIVAVIAAVLFFFGLNAAQKLSVDAFPDVTNVQVQIATEHPEFDKWRWIGADEMVASIVPFKRAVYEEVVRHFRAYLA